MTQTFMYAEIQLAPANPTDQEFLLQNEQVMVTSYFTETIQDGSERVVVEQEGTSVDIKDSDIRERVEWL